MARSVDPRLFLVALGMWAAGLAAAPAESPPGSAQPTPRLRRGTGFGSGVAFSPDGATLAAGRQDGTVALFPFSDLGAIGEPRSIGVADEQFSKFRSGPGPIRFSPDGAILVASNFLDPIDLRDHRRVGPDALRAWDVASGRVLYTVPMGGLGRTFAITADGRTLRATVSTGRDDDVIRSWDLKTGSPMVSVPLATPGVVATEFSPDGETLAVVAAWRETIAFHEVATGRVRSSWADRRGGEAPRRFHSLAYSPDGRTLAALGDDHVVQLWDVTSGKPRASIAPPPDDSIRHHYRMAFSADCRRLALAGGYSVPRPAGKPIAGRIILVDVATGARLVAFEGMSPSCRDLALTLDGRTLASTFVEFPGTVPEDTLSVYDVPADR
ncbi:WD40 repeat domain-containing protein [Tundrisphaera sp. TA3]|uniref:WD40 repeat domain-containing protein n=1 Tax=Tundrisphaera sp. TA3 TaxID=3435775 RepID=UPI003EB78C96